MDFSIQRTIEIDMGHRIPNHESKCRNLHGHRYKVTAVVTGVLQDVGSEEGMLIDFGFIKDDMITVIDEPCDHALCISISDVLLRTILGSPLLDRILGVELIESPETYYPIDSCVGKVHVIGAIPTAENLARHWFEGLKNKMAKRQAVIDKKCRLYQVTVWETPNCSATYPF